MSRRCWTASSHSWSAGYHSSVALEPALAALVTLLGIGVTTFGAFSHTPPAMAPGAALAFVGGGWLGNALARRRRLES